MLKVKPGVKIILIFSILAALLFLKIITPETHTGYDGSFYAAMTRELISDNPKTTTAPYSYRILSPWIVHFIPLKTETAFAVYNTIIYGFSAYLLFSLFLDYGYSLREAGLGVFFFFFSWVNVRFSFFYPVHIDGTYYLILIMAFRSLLRKESFVFWIALMLGAITREYFLTLIPVYYFYHKVKDRWWDFRTFRQTVAMAVLPLSLFILLRMLIPRANQDFNYYKHALYFIRIFFLYGRRAVHSYFNVYGAAMYIILLHIPTCLRFLRRNIYLAAYLIMSLCFLMIGGNDLCRINFIAFPVVLVLALQAMKTHREIYQKKVMVVFLAISHLYLMRIFQPMVTANYRKIWWSNISFCPEAVLRASCLRYALVGAAFLLLYLGLCLRLRFCRRCRSI